MNISLYRVCNDLGYNCVGTLANICRPLMENNLTILSYSYPNGRRVRDGGISAAIPKGRYSNSLFADALTQLIVVLATVFFGTFPGGPNGL